MTAPVADPTASTPLTLQDVRGPDYPEPGSQEVGKSGGKVVDYVLSLIRDTDASATTRYQKAARNLLFADGRQWIDWKRTERAWREVPVPDGKVRTVANYVRPILRSRQQRIVSSDFQWRVEPRTNDYEERDRATVGERFLNTRYAKSEMDGKVRLALFLAECCGVSYLKSFWNPTIGASQAATVTLPHPQTQQLTQYPISPDGSILADDKGDPLSPQAGAFTFRPGDTDTAVRTLFNVRLNPDATGLDPGEGFRWLVDMDMLPVAVIKERWGAIAKDVTSLQGSPLLSQYRNLVAAVGPLSFGNQNGAETQSMSSNGQKPTDLTLYAELWEARSELLPEGRLVILGGNVLLYDGPLPQGRILHTPVYGERRPFDPWGRPVVDDLVAPQRTINAQMSAILTELLGDGLNQWAVVDVPGLAEQISNYDRQPIKVPLRAMTANRGIGDLLMKVPPTPLNQARIEMISVAQKQMFDIGAFHEIQRGQVPPGVDSGIAVQYLMEAENAQLHDVVRQLQLSLIGWGRNQLALARWGYGEEEERWLPAGGAELSFLVESVDGTDLPDPDDLDITLDGFKPQSTAAYRAEIKEAAQLGWIDPNSALNLLGLGRGLRGAYLTESRQYTKARRENLAIEREQFIAGPSPDLSPTAGTLAFLHLDGSPFLLPSSDDHQKHIDVHNEIALDDTKPWPIRQAILLHIAEHQHIVQQQQAAMLALAAGPQSPPTSEGASNVN